MILDKKMFLHFCSFFFNKKLKILRFINYYKFFKTYFVLRTFKVIRNKSKLKYKYYFNTIKNNKLSRIMSNHLLFFVNKFRLKLRKKQKKSYLKKLK
jgi:hypothetical protein